MGEGEIGRLEDKETGRRGDKGNQNPEPGTQNPKPITNNQRPKTKDQRPKKRGDKGRLKRVSNL
jgi:hypothetical protein